MRRWAARHRGWAAALAFAALALVAFFAYRALFKAGSAGTVSYVTQAAETGTLVVSVSATGNVALGRTYEVVPAVTGVVRGLTVKVGDAVTERQVLFTLENAQLDANVTSAQAGYDQAQASVYNAEAQVEQSEQSLEQLQDAAADGNSNSTTPPTAAPPTTHPPTSLPPTSLPPTSTTAPPTTAPPITAHPTTAPPTTAPPTTSPPTTLPPTTAPPTTTPPTSDPPTTHPSVALLRSAARPRVVVALAAARGTTTATTASTGQQTAAVTDDDIEIAEKQLAASQASLSAAQANLANAEFTLQQAKASAGERTVTAPAAGTITVLSAQEGVALGSSSTSTSSSQASGQGTSGAGQSSQSAATIVDPQSISVVVQLNEVDIPQVKVDQKATLTFDALPDLTLAGVVTAADTIGTVSQGVVTYNVTVVPDTAPEQVRAGMTSSASIVTNVHQDVVLVPSAAVKTSTSGGSYVQVLVAGAPQQRTVEVGLTNDTSTEITSGLAAGDQVVTQTIDPNATQTTLRSGQGGFGGGGGIFLPGAGGPPGGR